MMSPKFESLSIVVEVGLLLGLNFKYGVHVILMNDFGGIATKCNHALKQEMLKIMQKIGQYLEFF